jgi:chromate transport protein ChrA
MTTGMKVMVFALIVSTVFLAGDSALGSDRVAVVGGVVLAMALVFLYRSEVSASRTYRGA